MLQNRLGIKLAFVFFAFQFVCAYLASKIFFQTLDFNTILIGVVIYSVGFLMLFVSVKGSLSRINNEVKGSASSVFFGVRIVYFFVLFFISIVLVKLDPLSLAVGLVQAKFSATVCLSFAERSRKSLS